MLGIDVTREVEDSRHPFESFDGLPPAVVDTPNFNAFLVYHHGRPITDQ